MTVNEVLLKVEEYLPAAIAFASMLFSMGYTIKRFKAVDVGPAVGKLVGSNSALINEVRNQTNTLREQNAVLKAEVSEMKEQHKVVMDKLDSVIAENVIMAEKLAIELNKIALANVELRAKSRRKNDGCEGVQ